MKITMKSLRKMIKESIDLLNNETGEIMKIDYIPNEYNQFVVYDEKSKMSTLDNEHFVSLYDLLYPSKKNSDFVHHEHDVNDFDNSSLNSLEFLENEALNMKDDSLANEDTAFDLAAGLKYSFPKEWKEALKHDNFRLSYHKQNDLIQYLAEFIVN